MNAQPAAKGKAHAGPKPDDGQLEAVPGEPVKNYGKNRTAQHTEGCVE